MLASSFSLSPPKQAVADLSSILFQESISHPPKPLLITPTTTTQYDHHHHLRILHLFFFFTSTANIRLHSYPAPSSSSTSMAAQQQLHQDPSPSSSTHPTPSSSSRRVPPPCWTHQETSALIDAYHEKWYSLRRGNLKASHWQEVADSVTTRCNLVVPSKTSVQCRHKIEKLRKRYRSERQRALTIPNRRFSSSWVYFQKMDFMEKGPSFPAAAANSDDNAEDEDEEEEEVEVEMEAEKEENGNDDDYNEGGFGFDGGYNGDLRNLHHRPMSSGRGGGGFAGGDGGDGGVGFRFRVPSGRRAVPNVAGFGKPKSYGSRFDEIPKYNPNFNNPSSSSRFLNGGSWSKSGTGRSNGGGGGGGNRGEKREMNPVAEMVNSIRLLGEGFVKMEKMKIEMARDMEHMRMEMEMK